MKKSMLVMALMLVVVGCGTNLIQTTNDPITGRTSVEYAQTLPLTYEGEGTGELVSFLSAQDYQNPEYGINVRYVYDGDISCVGMVIEFTAQDWMFIKQATVLLSSGEHYEFTDDNPYRDVRSGGVFERSSYMIPAEILQALCEGSVSMIRVQGDHLYQDLTIPAATLSKLGAFWTNLIAKHPEVLEETTITAIGKNN